MHPGVSWGVLGYPGVIRRPFTISKKYCCRKMDGNKIFHISELFRCYFDLFFDVSFLCLVILCFVFSVFLLFYVLLVYVLS